jgi:hypothetical protein
MRRGTSCTSCRRSTNEFCMDTFEEENPCTPTPRPCNASTPPCATRPHHHDRLLCAHAASGTVHWEAHYLVSATVRKVSNIIDGTFTPDGLIATHRYSATNAINYKE